jgi:hypothetical protein
MRTFYFVLFCLLVGLSALTRVYIWRGNLLHGWDAQFYYAVSRSLLVSGDIDVTNDLAVTSSPTIFDPNQDGIVLDPNEKEIAKRVPLHAGRAYNKYPVGLSFAELPWLAVGCLLRRAFSIFGYATTMALGYGPIETATVAIGLLAYVIGGLALLRAILVRLAGEVGSSLAVLAAWTGTSLFYYTAIAHFMAHGVAFALVCVILHRVYMMRTRGTSVCQDWYVLAASSGLLFLVRPQQILLLPLVVVALLPLVRRADFKARDLIGSITLFSAVCLVLPFFNYLNMGEFSLFAYHGEGFDFASPHWGIVLFHIKRGLFIISPVIVIALVGLACYGRSWLDGVVLMHGIIQLYLIACWSSPLRSWTAPIEDISFGERMWCECVPLVAVGLARLWQHSRYRGRLLWGGIAAAACIWTIIHAVLAFTGQRFLLANLWH